MTSTVSGLPAITVSLTTYPARIATVHIVVENMLSQTLKPARVVLWLARSQFPGGEPSLPESLLGLRSRGLVIDWCEDTRSYKKLLPSLAKYPDDLLVLVDDDLVYDDDMIEKLVECHRRFPTALCSMRTHMIRFGEDGRPLPYASWRMEYGRVLEPSMSLFATTGGGTLLPPHILPAYAASGEPLEVCPAADDVWLKVMLTVNKIPVVLAAPNRPLRYIPGTQGETLWSHNLTAGGNDRQLAAAVNLCAEKHGVDPAEFYAALRDGSYGFCPELSVLLVADDGCSPAGALESVLAQSLYGVEAVCLPRTEGARAAFERFAANRRVRLLPTDGESDLLRCLCAAASAASGDRLLVLSPADRLDEGFLRTMMARIVHRSADIVRFAAHMQGDVDNAVYPDASRLCADSGELLRGEFIFSETLSVCSGKPFDMQYLLCDKLIDRALWDRALSYGLPESELDAAAPAYILARLADEADGMLTFTAAPGLRHDERISAVCRGDFAAQTAAALDAAPERARETLSGRLLACGAGAALRGEITPDELLLSWPTGQVIAALTEAAAGDSFALAECLGRCYPHTAVNTASHCTVVCDYDRLDDLQCRLSDGEAELTFQHLHPAVTVDAFCKYLNDSACDAVVLDLAAFADSGLLMSYIAASRMCGCAVLFYLDSRMPANAALVYSPALLRTAAAIVVTDLNSASVARLMGARVFFISGESAPEMWCRAVIAARCTEKDDVSAPPLASAVGNMLGELRARGSADASAVAEADRSSELHVFACEAVRREVDAQSAVEADLRAHLEKYAADAKHLKECIATRDRRIETEIATSRRLSDENGRLHRELDQQRRELEEIRGMNSYRFLLWCGRVRDKLRGLFRSSDNSTDKQD